MTLIVSSSPETVFRMSCLLNQPFCVVSDVITTLPLSFTLQVILSVSFANCTFGTSSFGNEYEVFEMRFPETSSDASKSYDRFMVTVGIMRSSVVST